MTVPAIRSGTVIQFKPPRAQEPIRIMDPDYRYPPGVSFAGMVLVSIGIWWLAAYLIWKNI